MDSEDKELLRDKIRSGFAPCFIDGCERRLQCLRWVGREYADPVPLVLTCVNSAHPAVGGAVCPLFRSTQKVRFAHGLVTLLNKMPREMGNALMAWLKAECHRTYAYEYRNGSRPIGPQLQQRIADRCRQLGWDRDVVFDAYSEDYEW